MNPKQRLLSHAVSVIEQDLLPLRLCKGHHSYAWPITEGFSGWFGLNTITARGDGLVGINPIVGVICESIEDLLKKYDRAARKGITPTISTSIGYLMPEKRYVEWLFDPNPDFDLEAEAQKIARAVRQFGVPFAEANASLAVVTANLEQLQFTYRESAVYRLPIAYLLLGDRDRARECLANSGTSRIELMMSSTNIGSLRPHSTKMH